MFWNRKQKQAEPPKPNVVEHAKCATADGNPARLFYVFEDLGNFSTCGSGKERLWHQLAGLGLPWRGDCHPANRGKCCYDFDVFGSSHKYLRVQFYYDGLDSERVKACDAMNRLRKAVESLPPTMPAEPPPVPVDYVDKGCGCRATQSRVPNAAVADAKPTMTRGYEVMASLFNKHLNSQGYIALEPSKVTTIIDAEIARAKAEEREACAQVAYSRRLNCTIAAWIAMSEAQRDIYRNRNATCTIICETIRARS